DSARCAKDCLASSHNVFQHQHDKVESRSDSERGPAKPLSSLAREHNAGENREKLERVDHRQPVVPQHVFDGIGNCDFYESPEKLSQSSNPPEALSIILVFIRDAFKHLADDL